MAGQIAIFSKFHRIDPLDGMRKKKSRKQEHKKEGSKQNIQFACILYLIY